jgi:hypothetical protein
MLPKPSTMTKRWSRWLLLQLEDLIASIWGEQAVLVQGSQDLQQATEQIFWTSLESKEAS